MFFILFHIEGVVFFCLNERNEYSDLPLGKRMTRHILTVEEILQFPDDYHTKGILSLPYGDIVEPFEAWYSKTKKMSRIDYYNGEKKVEKIAGNIVECEVKCSFVLTRFAKAPAT